MSSKKPSVKKAYELNALVRKKFSSGKIPAELYPYIGEKYGEKKRILFIEWGAEWNDNEKAKDAEKYYSGELDYDSHIDIKNCSQRREIEEALLKAKDCVSAESLAWYNFFVRPMQPGSCEFVRELFDIPDKEERKKILEKMGIGKTDLEKSSEMFKALIKSFRPDIILIFGDTLKDVLDNNVFEKMNFEDMLHSRYSSPVSVHVIPFSYFEKADLDHKLCYMERYGFGGERDSVILDMKKDSGRYDYGEVAFYLQNEIKMLGLGDYEYYKKKIAECQEMVLKDCRCYEDFMRNVENERKRMVKNSYLDLNETKNGRNHKACRLVDLGGEAMKIQAEPRLQACFWRVEREQMYFNLLCNCFDKIFKLTERHPNKEQQENAEKAQKVRAVEKEYKKLRAKRRFDECRDIEIKLREKYNVVIDKNLKDPKFNSVRKIKQLYEKTPNHGNEVVFINLKTLKECYEKARKRHEDAVCEEIKADLKKLHVIIEETPDSFVVLNE